MANFQRPVDNAPLFFLIDRWGGKRRSIASLNFVLYTMGGSVFILRSRELILVAVLCSFILLAGIFPGVILGITRTASENWISLLMN